MNTGCQDRTNRDCFIWYTHHKIITMIDDGYKTSVKIGPLFIGSWVMDFDDIECDYYRVGKFWLWLWKAFGRP